MRLAAKKDANHGEIASAFRALGCDVLDLSRVGDGCPDLLVRVRSRNRWLLVEIKVRTGRIRDAQREFAERWPVAVVRSVDEVAELLKREE